MTVTLHVFSPAKLNLFLHILGKNPNGYHQIQTIFQLVDVGDRLKFELTHNKKIECIAPNCSFSIEKNLAYRAAKLLQQRYNCHDNGVTIYLDKQLPTGAGLGGGSSNAGATLRALNQLWQLNASTEELIALATELGADVAVFVGKQNAWAEGIGEQLTPINLPLQDYVILNPRCPISTQELFQHPDLPRNTAPLSIKDYSFATTKNDFEQLVCLFLPIPNKSLGETIKQQAPSQWDIITCSAQLF
jgi:4-diphosphocytidyl-2-C-methyl-D-erythritol kinase